jgi:hypothetical protein
MMSKVKDCKSCALLRRCADSDMVSCAPESDPAVSRWIDSVEDWDEGYPVGDRHSDCPAWAPTVAQTNEVEA